MRSRTPSCKQSWQSILLALLLGMAVESCALFGSPPADREHQIERSLAAGDTARAVKLLGGVIHDGNASPTDYARLGILLREEGTIRGRARSQQSLERGLQLFPDDLTLSLELGKTYYRQTLYGDAARQFERVLELDPGHCEAQFWLAKHYYRKWAHVQLYKDYLQEARSLARQVVGCDPGNSAALYMLAFSLYVLGETEEAIARIDEFIASNPSDPRGQLLRGTVEFESFHYDECAELFDRGVSLLPESESKLLESIALLLDEDGAEEYDSASPERRAEMERAFWIPLDPDPTTPLNQRHLEHLYRMFLSDQYFRHHLPPLRGWETERGRALVKFGWPQVVGTTLEGDFTSGRMEVWQYASPRNFFTLYFRDEFLNGNYMVPMDYRFSYAAQTLYLEEPTTEYVSPYANIPGLVDLTAFRNSSVGTDVYMAVTIDADSMGAFFSRELPSHLYARSAVFDGDWSPLDYNADTLKTAGMWRGAPGTTEPYEIVRRFHLGFGQHRMAICVEDDLARTQTIVQDETNTMRFLSDSLTTSDILLHRGSAPDTSTPAIVRGPHVLLPNPGHIYGLGEKLNIYFEVYNLQVRESRNRYDITYSIYDAGRDVGTWTRFRQGFERMIGVAEVPAPVISQTIERSGRLHKAQENITIDIDTLSEGSYVLQIAVRDRIGERGSTAEQAFVKVEKQRAAAR